MSEAALLGHVNSAGSPAVEGSPDVFVGGVPALRAGDGFADNSRVVSGAPHVFINGKAAARKGDPVTNGGTVAKGCPRVCIGNGGGAGYGREMLFASLTDPKDKVILCLAEIALAEHQRADARDKPGWMLLHEALSKWLSGAAYSMRDKYDNGGQKPSWVQWDWLMRYARFRRTVAAMLAPEYLSGPKAHNILETILEKDGAFQAPFDGKERPFDHTGLDWAKLRSHAFQSRPIVPLVEGAGKVNYAEWLAGNKPDGLAAAIAEFVLLAVAKGSTRVDKSGKRTIYVDAVGLFIHDGFDFGGDQELGYWDCEGKAFSWTGEKLNNRAFRDFRKHTGYGCDFRIMNKPELYTVKRFCYDVGT